MDVREWLGPQSDGDDALTARYRFHQSWYRAFVLAIPCGTGPRPSNTSRYGNMLRAEDGAAGRNFLTEELRQIAEERIGEGGTVEPFRARHNMLSSMPMCFNLFGQLKRRPALARAFAESVVGEAVTSVAVELEDSPALLGDRTGFDASIRWEASTGTRGILAIETKLTEQFSAKVYGLDDHEAYRRFSTAQGAPFDRDRLEELTDSRWNQLWRNHMLAEAVRVTDGLDAARQVVVFPAAAESTRTLVASYRDLLTNPDAVIDITLEQVLDRTAPALDSADHSWLQAFRMRYVDLELSEPLYQAYRNSTEPFS